MKLVDNLDQVLNNVALLDDVRSGNWPANYEAYASLIKRGTCFLPYPTSTGLAFAPSRFIGYVNNSFSKHVQNDARDGRQTNAALNAIFGQRPTEDPTLEYQYRRFCDEIGIIPPRTGTFGVARKYWVTKDVLDHLELIAQISVLESPKLTATEKDQIIKARVGQGIFRDALVDHWKGRCCVTGCSIGPVLRASHIKPWRESTNAERLDKFNGLLLVANIDALFDRGFISFDDDGQILRSPDISADTLSSLGCDTSMKIKIAPRHAPYLAYHRNNIFARHTAEAHPVATAP